jgi:hypothetical protein
MCLASSAGGGVNLRKEPAPPAAPSARHPISPSAAAGAPALDEEGGHREYPSGQLSEELLTKSLIEWSEQLVAVQKRPWRGSP